MSRLAQLLDVQQHDTRADQLRHRRANLPERDELNAATAKIDSTTRVLSAVEMERQTLAADQDRLESEISSARDRVKTVEAKMYGGSVSNPRELQALQDEVESLQRRIGLLEDEELAVMERLEPVDSTCQGHQRELERLDSETSRLQDSIVAAEAEVDVELTANEGERSKSVEGVPADLLREYEQIRLTSGGVAVAPLVGGQCGGCHMRLSSMELDRVKKQPEDAVIHCEECGRLLVR